MGYRLSKIMTKTGDNGTTQIEVGKRIAKNHPSIIALGDLDELNSAIGLILAYPIQTPSISVFLRQVQQDLFNISGELCPPHRPAIDEEVILHLEHALNQWNAELPPLQEFILPGGNVVSAHCHLARTICRRAERSLVQLHHHSPLRLELLSYLNRLSDVLFVLARVTARETEASEIVWEHHRH